MSLAKNHQSPVFFVFIFALLLALPAWSRDYVYQNQETQDLTQVEVVNKSRQTQTVWVLFYDREFIEEHAFDVPARSRKILDLDGLKKPQWTFAVLTKSAQVMPVSGKAADAYSSQNMMSSFAQNLTSTIAPPSQPSVEDQASGSTNTIWDWTAGTRYEVKVKGFQALQLKLFNLFIEKQKVLVSYLSASGAVLSTENFVTAAFRQNLVKDLALPSGTNRVVIQSEEAVLLSSNQLFMSAVDNKRVVSGEFKYFLVQGGTDGSSFVVPMNDPTLVQKAREEILNPQGFIVFADIETNSSQANRDFTSPQKVYWSWSIKKVTGMAQIGADWCQAYPEMIERMLHNMLAQQSVCFRGQRIIRELKPSEVQSGVLN